MTDNIEVLRGLANAVEAALGWREGKRDAELDALLDMATGILNAMGAGDTGALAAMAAQAEACKTCDGRGEVGGHVGQTPEQFDYVSEPCPECAAPQQPEAQAGGEAVAWASDDYSEFCSARIKTEHGYDWMTIPLYALTNPERGDGSITEDTK